MVLSYLWRLTKRFVSIWNRNRWQLALLSVPLSRAMLYTLDLSPAQLREEVVPQPWQSIALCVLGTAALTGMIGVMRDRPIIERAGMQMLGPFAVLYGIGSFTSDPRRGTVTIVVYGMIAACCFARSREITKAMRIVNSNLKGAPSGAVHIEDGQ